MPATDPDLLTIYRIERAKWRTNPARYNIPSDHLSQEVHSYLATVLAYIQRGLGRLDKPESGQATTEARLGESLQALCSMVLGDSLI